jgi:hypothetical protein
VQDAKVYQFLSMLANVLLNLFLQMVVGRQGRDPFIFKRSSNSKVVEALIGIIIKAQGLMCYVIIVASASCIR